MIICFQTMLSERSFLYCLLGFQWTITPFIFWIIWNYLSSKPLGKKSSVNTFVKEILLQHFIILHFLGMQTIFDQMIKDLIISSVIACLGTTLTNLEYERMSSSVAIFLIYFQRFGAILFFCQILSTFVIKYMCIYHPNYIEYQDENVIINSSR